MPAWTKNKFEIKRRETNGGFESIKSIIELKQNTPFKLFDSLIGKRKDYSEDNSVDHNIEYYGTKWDVAFNKIEVEIFDNYLNLRFETARNPPISFAEKLSYKYNVDCALKYYGGVLGEAGCFRATEDGSYDDYNGLLEGLYEYDRSQFWDSLELEYKSGFSSLDDFFGYLRSFVSDEDLIMIKTSFDDMEARKYKIDALVKKISQKKYGTKNNSRLDSSQVK